jgi:stage V sporulation protein SpoVS
VVDVAATVVAHRGADVFRHAGEIANQVFSALAVERRVLFERGIQILHVGPVVQVVVNLHGLRINVGFKRGVVVGESREFVCHSLLNPPE